jgi:hypothetical protein
VTPGSSLTAITKRPSFKRKLKLRLAKNLRIEVISLLKGMLTPLKMSQRGFPRRLWGAAGSGSSSSSWYGASIISVLGIKNSLCGPRC